MTRLILPIIAVLFLLPACQGEQKEEVAYQTVEGQTMGTYYRVTYQDSLKRDWKQAIDSLLVDLNQEVSTYIPSSTISQFNQADERFSIMGKKHFTTNLERGLDIYKDTEGYFDPTVMPLVNYWGFGYTEKRKVTAVDSLKIDSLRQLVGMNKLVIEDDGILLKPLAGLQLDFSAIAKGYGVDLVGYLLEDAGINNYLVDIGGETRARGYSNRGDAWRIGINMPREDAGLQDVQAVVRLEDKSIATSGNYRNFYEVEGAKYSHTISPFSGFPERTNLLSASVFAGDCTTADAYATAFMVMGVEKALQKAASMPEIEAYFIIGTEDGGMDIRYTDGMQNIIEK